MRLPFTNWTIHFIKNQTDRDEIGDRRAGAVMSDEIKYNNYRLSFDSLYDVYRHNADTRNCVRELRQNVGALGWKLQDLRDPEVTVNPQDIDNLKFVLNNLQTWKSLQDRIVRDRSIAGNSYIHKVPNMAGTRIVGLQAIDPRTMGIISTTEGEVIEYVQKVSTGSSIRTVTFDPSEIIHIKDDSDVNNEIFGAAPMEAFIWEIKTDLAASMANYFFFENDARPAVQLILDPKLNKEKVEKLKKEFEEKFKGVRQRKRTAILQGVTEIKTVSVNQKDMEFLQGRKFATEKICASFGVPKFMLGYTDTVNNNNGIELTKNFFVNTIEPIEDTIGQAFSRDLLTDPRLGMENYKFFYPKRNLVDEAKALEEYKSGALTLRQYKMKTGQEITKDDEDVPNFDSYILHSGGAARLLEDVGVEPVLDPNDENQTNKIVKVFEHIGHGASN